MRMCTFVYALYSHKPEVKEHLAEIRLSLGFRFRSQQNELHCSKSMAFWVNTVAMWAGFSGDGPR